MERQQIRMIVYNGRINRIENREYRIKNYTMSYNKSYIYRISILLLFVCLFIDCFGQGQLTRPNASVSKSKRSELSISNPDGYINGHGYVDLGLPSKTKWAICNIGAEEPIQEGKKYAWGELNDKTDYNETNCLTYQKSFDDISGNPSFDVAQSLWGTEWNLPTREDLGEIEYYCKWKWIKYKGVFGIKLIGPNGKSIFLPAPQVDQWNQYVGNYWLSEPIGKMFGTDNTSAWAISISKGTMVKGISNTAQGMILRYTGQMVRPVSK